MSSDRHRRFLEEAARREAQKAFRERGRSGAVLEDFFALRVQTVEPWKRLSAIVVGAFFLGLAAWALKEEFTIWAIVAFSAIGTIESDLASALPLNAAEAFLRVFATSRMVALMVNRPDRREFWAGAVEGGVTAQLHRPAARSRRGAAGGIGLARFAVPVTRVA